MMKRYENGEYVDFSEEEIIEYENAQKENLYNAVYNPVSGDTANALKEVIRGKSIIIKDVSPLIKAMTLTLIGKYTDETTIYRVGQNNWDGTVERDMSTAYICSVNHIPVTAGKSYCLYCDFPVTIWEEYSDMFPKISYYDENKNELTDCTHSARRNDIITIPENCSYVKFEAYDTFSESSLNANTLIIGELTLYTPNINGQVIIIPPFNSTEIIFVNEENVSLECEYNKDINEAICKSIETGTGTDSVQQKLDKTEFDIDATNNPNKDEAIDLAGQKLNKDVNGKIISGAFGNLSISVNGKSQAAGKRSMSQGSGSLAIGANSFAGGLETIALGNNTHAEGIGTTAIGDFSHTEGEQTISYSMRSHTEGSHTVTRGDASHAEGYHTQTGDIDENGEYVNKSGNYAHAEGESTKAIGMASHTEGKETKAIGDYSHASGYNTEANGIGSTSIGDHTIASGNYTLVRGKYNVEDKTVSEEENYGHGSFADIVGNGILVRDKDGNPVREERSNAYMLDWGGSGYYAGDVYTHVLTDAEAGVPLVDDRHKLVTEGEIDDKFNEFVSEIDDKFITEDELNTRLENIDVSIDTSNIPTKTEVSNAVKGKTKQSNYAIITDISPIEHNIKIKTTKKIGWITCYGQNLWDEQVYLAQTNQDLDAPMDTLGSYNKISINPIMSSLYVHCSNLNDDTILFARFCFYNSSDTLIQTLTDVRNNSEITIPSNTSHARFVLSLNYFTTGEKIYNNDICINVFNEKINGTYVPYQHHKLIKSNDYTAEISSIYPVLILDSDNVLTMYNTNFSCEYNKDINAIVDSIGNSSGGDGTNVDIDINIEDGRGTNSIQQKTCSSNGIQSSAIGNNTVAHLDNSHVEGLNSSTIEKLYCFIPTAQNGKTITCADDDFTYLEDGSTYVIYNGLDDDGITPLFVYGKIRNINRDNKTFDIEHDIDYINYFEENMETKRYIFSKCIIINGGIRGSQEVDLRDFQVSSHAEGLGVIAGLNSHAEGTYTSALGIGSHTEGHKTSTLGYYSHAEGDSTISQGFASHAEGKNSYAYAHSSHVEGQDNIVDPFAIAGHAEGIETITEGLASHTEGYHTRTHADYAHAEGELCRAEARGSHAEGIGTVTSAEGQHTSGKWNLEDEYKAVIVGNGSGEDEFDYTGKLISKNRKNIYSLDWDGNGWFAGNVTVGENADKLATEKIVDEKIASFVDSAPDTLNTLNELAAALGDDSNFATSVAEEIGKKVDKVDGKDLSTNDFSNEYKNAIDRLDNSIDTLVIGEAAQADGNTTIALGNYSHAEGQGSIGSTYSYLGYSIETLDMGIASISEDKTILTTTTPKKVVLEEMLEALFSNASYGFILKLSGNKYIPVKSCEVKGSLLEGYYLDLTLYNPCTDEEVSEIQGKLIEDIYFGVAYGEGSHSEGYRNLAIGNNSHAEGKTTVAIGEASHTEGDKTKTLTEYAHAEGYETTASGKAAHSEGYQSKAEGQFSHAEGRNTRANGENSHAEGQDTEANNMNSHSEGYQSKANGIHSHAEGRTSIADGENSHAEGYNAHTTGENSHAEGEWTIAGGKNSHAEGYDSKAESNNSHAEGETTTASARNAHSEGYKTTASGENSHAEGGGTTSSGKRSHAEGYNTKATGKSSHAEGYDSQSNGENSHAEGRNTKSIGLNSHSEGQDTEARGTNSHAEGLGTIATASESHVEGRYNVVDNENKYVKIIGNGTSLADNKRSNAYTLDWEGNAWFAGDVETNSIILRSSTPGSTKKFKLSIDDSGTLTTTEIIEAETTGEIENA